MQHSTSTMTSLGLLRGPPTAMEDGERSTRDGKCEAVGWTIQIQLGMVRLFILDYHIVRVDDGPQWWGHKLIYSAYR